MVHTICDLEKRFLLPQFVIFSNVNEQLALLWDENDIVGNWHVWPNAGGNADGFHLVLHPLFTGRCSMFHSVWESNILLYSQDWNMQSRQNSEDWLFRRWELHCNKLFTITAFHATKGKSFFLFHWRKLGAYKKCYFSLRMVSLKFVHRHLKSLIYFDVLGDFSCSYLPQETQWILMIINVYYYFN